MPEIRTEDLTYRYGRTLALEAVDLEVPAGVIYALLGPNGAGKTTLLQILAGIRHATRGRATVRGLDVQRLGVADRADIGWVAEGQALPEWMTLRQLENFLAPLYERWDAALADQLRQQFRLDPGRKLGRLSRGEKMKAALLTALAPRPRLLILDEPFTGLDALTKDELVRGLLETAGAEGQTVLISSHDLAELEPLADWVGFIEGGRLLISERMESMRQRFMRVEILGGPLDAPDDRDLGGEWLDLEVSGPRMTFLLRLEDEGYDAERLRAEFPLATRVEVRSATLREVFLALARQRPKGPVARQVVA